MTIHGRSFDNFWIDGDYDLFIEEEKTLHENIINWDDFWADDKLLYHDIPEPTFAELVAEARTMAIDHRYGIGFRWTGLTMAEFDIVDFIDRLHKDRLFEIEEGFCPTVALPNGYRICL